LVYHKSLLLVRDSIFGSGSTTSGGIDGPLRLMSGRNHLSPLADSNIGVDAGRDECQPRSDYNPYLKSVLAILVGLATSFYVFWNMEFGVRYWRWQIWLTLEVVSLALFGYGFGLLLDIAVKSR
jgi:hypothetical protein